MDGFDAIRYVMDNNIDGAIVECGVGEGNFEAVCITELMARGQARDIHMFDTFKGLTAPGVNDYTTDDTPFYKMTNHEVVEEWNKHVVVDGLNNWCYCSLERVQERLNEFNYDQSKLHYVIGDVMDTLALPVNIPEKIALLRLDTDWYESSKFELLKLYGNVVSGGLIIFDDYHHWAGQKKAVDEFFVEINHAPSLIPVDTVKAVSMIKP
jgi:O-methyltransferase